MKNSILIFVLLVGFQYLTAQEFTPSKNYFISLQSTLAEDDQEQQQAVVNLQDDTPKEITYFPIAHSEAIASIEISTIENPNLKGVTKILKVDVIYLEYCKYIISNYIIETENGAFINLPMLTNEVCNDSKSEFVYLFPSQEFGKDNTIITAQVTLENSQITMVDTEDTLIWNDDSYGTSGNIYQDF